MTKPTRVVLGLDGGGTKTTCVVIPSTKSDELVATGNAPPDPLDFIPPPILGQAQTESSNWNSVGIDRAHHNCKLAILSALADANHSRETVDMICLGMSGVDRASDRAQVKQWIDAILPGVPTIIHNDAVIALASGTGGDIFGIVLISGTGMIAYGFDRAGQRSRAGGWGALLGDGGSGYAIGASVLRAVTWSADGRGPKTKLHDALLDSLGLQEADELIRWAYEEPSWQRFAQVAPLAFHYAAINDPIARQIVQQAANDLALAAATVARRLDIEKDRFPLILAGRNLRPGYFADAVAERLRNNLPAAFIVFPKVEPAVGAAMLAQQRQGSSA